jgi:hypothetical protein
MPDDDKLTPADPREVVTALSLGLTAKPPLARYQAAETMAKLVAERLVEHLERSGFVVMRKPAPATGAGDNPGRRGFEGQRPLTGIAISMAWLRSQSPPRLSRL